MATTVKSNPNIYNGHDQLVTNEFVSPHPQNNRCQVVEHKPSVVDEEQITHEFNRDDKDITVSDAEGGFGAGTGNQIEDGFSMEAGNDLDDAATGVKLSLSC